MEMLYLIGLLLHQDEVLFHSQVCLLVGKQVGHFYLFLHLLVFLLVVILPFRLLDLRKCLDLCFSTFLFFVFVLFVFYHCFFILFFFGPVRDLGIIFIIVFLFFFHTFLVSFTEFQSALNCCTRFSHNSVSPIVSNMEQTFTYGSSLL